MAGQAGASVGPGAAPLGMARLGVARVADGSTGGFGSLCCPLWRVDRVGFGAVRLGRVGSGAAGSGKASMGHHRQGLQTAVRRVRPPYCSLGNRLGRVEQGVAWSATDGFGNARHGNNDSARKVSAFPLGSKT